MPSSRTGPQLRRFGPLRHLAESLILLAIVVALFRSFAVEGYLISTGSMAPTLLGYHRRVICPKCHYLFARGSAFDTDTDATAVAGTDFVMEGETTLPARCPNCGLSEIPAETVPRNEGDQLLVQKQAFEFRDPRRWEVIVFRNPADFRQAYVKRVVGTPGERIEIRSGEIFADGQLCRKPYSVQRAIRIPVHVYAHQPDQNDETCRPRWRRSQQESAWLLDREALCFAPTPQQSGDHVDWIEYRHWIASGGSHMTSVRLPELEPGNGFEQETISLVNWEEGMLSCRGALPPTLRQRWLERATSPSLREAIETLYERSHCAPISDEYGYNAESDTTPVSVNDFMLSLVLQDVSGTGRFEVELTDGERLFRTVLDYGRAELALFVDDDPEPVRRATMPRDLLQNSLRLDVSLFDQQAIVAVNEIEQFPAWEYQASDHRRPVRQPARIGASGLQLTVQELTLYRDIHYTDPVDRELTPQQLADDEFYVLGDNSPVSIDSRVWDEPAVPRAALIGKPILVHLPSRQSRWEWGGETRYLRIPDFSRIRAIR